MILPLKLELDEVIRLTKDANDVYYRVGAKFVTNRSAILANCKLDANQKATVMSYPEKGSFKLVTKELGTFDLHI